MTRTLLQQVLDALTNCLSEHGHRCNRCDSEIDEGGKLIAALRSALAAPQPEPVPEPYLCIMPACGNDCSGCNKAISPQTMRDYAIGYAMLRNAPIEAIRAGGVFAGRTPDNVVINGADLDAATFGAAAQQSIDQQVESINAVFEAWRNGEDASMTLALAAPPAAPAPTAPVPDGWVMVPREPTPEMLAVVRNGPMHETWTEGYCAMIAASPAAPVVREPVIDEMDAVASKYAHKMALDLECVLSDYHGKWWNTAMQTLGAYREAMNAIHERESPTHMGEPLIAARKDGR